MEEPAIAEITSTPIAEPTPVFQKPEKPAILGHNLKHVTIIVQYPQDVHLPDAQLQFLSALLTACKLTVADVAIHNFQNRNEFKAADITSFLKSKTVLLFGVSPTGFGLPIDFPAFQIQPLAGITYLYSPNLEYFQTADDAEMKLRKSQLWLCLKQIFHI